MARIFYSVAGEGRGHATRVRALVEDLRHEHQVVLFAAGDAHQMLAQTYRKSDIRVHRIPGLRFQYSNNGINYLRTLCSGLRFLRQLGRLVGFLEEIMRRRRPDLVITDFEPALPRAARRCGIPFISFDHQHFLRTYDLSSLPFWLRVRAWGLAKVVGLFYSGQAETIVSSFYFPPLRSSCQNVTQIGVMLRPEVIAARRECGQHLLVYLRREVPENVLRTLRQCGRPVKVYGVGERPRDGNLEFRPIADREFIVDLASCHAVVSTAGNQLVGEALYLKKPVLALPERKNYEQRINGHFLAQSGCGNWLKIESLDTQSLGSFLDRVEDFRRNIQPERVHGNLAALAAIRRHLPAPAPVRHIPAVKEAVLS
jgi:uncharacterized protein (TIGR00661 family)